jgi:large-conductance mechanosensitive channel
MLLTLRIQGEVMRRIAVSLIISLVFTLIISYISIKYKELEAKKSSLDEGNANRKYIDLNIYTVMNFAMISLVVYMIVPR